MINIINVSTRQSKMNYQYRKSSFKFHGTKKNKNRNKYNSCLMIQNFFHLTEFCTATTSFKYFNPSDVPTKSYPHRGTRTDWSNPLLGFWYVAVFWKGTTFRGKPLIFSTRWGKIYGWWCCWRPVTSPNMVAILNRVKTPRTGNVLCMTCSLIPK